MTIVGRAYIKKMAERLFNLTYPHDKSVITVYVLEKFIAQIISDVEEGKNRVA